MAYFGPIFSKLISIGFFNRGFGHDQIEGIPILLCVFGCNDNIYISPDSVKGLVGISLFAAGSAIINASTPVSLSFWYINAMVSHRPCSKCYFPSVSLRSLAAV